MIEKIAENREIKKIARIIFLYFGILPVYYGNASLTRCARYSKRLCADLSKASILSLKNDWAFLKLENISAVGTPPDNIVSMASKIVVAPSRITTPFSIRSSVSDLAPMSIVVSFATFKFSKSFESRESNPFSWTFISLAFWITLRKSVKSLFSYFSLISERVGINSWFATVTIALKRLVRSFKASRYSLLATDFGTRTFCSFNFGIIFSGGNAVVWFDW